VQLARSDVAAESRGSSGSRSRGSRSTRSSDSVSVEGQWTLHEDERRLVQQLLGSATALSDSENGDDDADYLNLGELLGRGRAGAGASTDERSRDRDGGSDVYDDRSFNSSEMLPLEETDIIITASNHV
jgi:hypothetical protein